MSNNLEPELEDARNDVSRIYTQHTQDTLASNPHPDPVHHLVDAVLTLATVIRMQDK